MKDNKTVTGPTMNPKKEFRFDFVGWAPLLTGLSAIATLVSVVLIMTKGLNYGIDFAGGTEVQVKFNAPVEASKVRSFAEEMGFQAPSVQSVGDRSEYIIRMGTIKGSTDKETNEILKATVAKFTEGLASSFEGQEAKLLRLDTVGPQVGDELKRNGLLAGFYSLLMILIYIGLRFDYKFAPGAVICLFHDCLVTLGIFVLIQMEMNVQTMAAVLTLIGFSLNDTIINYDRIRENLAIYRDKPMSWIVNRSVNDVFSRTILTSATTLMSAVALYYIAGGVIRDLAFTLGIGMIIGTYSSIYVASPIVMAIDYLQKRKATT